MFDRLKSIAKGFKRELRLYQLVLKDRRTPRLARLFLGLAVGYALMPFDIIPDFIPVLGQLDDAIIVPIFVIVAVKLIPKIVIEECRMKVNSETAL